MRDFNSLSPADALVLLDSTVSGLTVFGRVPKGEPIELLRAFIDSVLAGELRLAASAYSNLTTSLLTCGARRVSGNIWKDYILDVMLLHDGPFAKAAASGRMDNAVFSAVRSDLALMQQLFSLDEELLAGLAKDRARELGAKGRTPSDTASAIATAAWGGGTVHHVPKEYKLPAPAPSFKHVFSWNYGEFGITDSYFADEALEGMYRRFLEEENWSELIDNLWNFHSTYGSGQFLRYRNFFFDGNGMNLKPMPDLRPGDFVPLSENEYGRLINNAIAFMRDECAKPMLLCGGHGMGKTTMMLELTDELPQLHLVYVTGGFAELPALFEILKQQPLKFMALIDNLRPGQLEGIVEPLIPMNVLLAACSAESIQTGLFEVTVTLPHIQLGEFVQTVHKLLEARQLSIPMEVIRSACVDYQVDTRCEFNIASAVRIAELLQS